MSGTKARTGPRALSALGILALLASLLAIASPVAAGADVGTFAIFKTMCQNIGQQDTCNGRDDSLVDYHIDFTVDPVDANGDPREGQSEIITVTLGDNDGDGGNLGGGSQGRKQGGDLQPGFYLVCEIPIAYKDGEDDVPLAVLPRPDASGGGSTGGSQAQFGDACVLVNLGTGTEEVKFLDQQIPEPETGSLLVLKTDDDEPANPLADAEFTVHDSQDVQVNGIFTTDADGLFCVEGLALGETYTVTETAAPAGHELASPADQDVEVTVEGTCAEREDAPDATFVNPVIVVPPTPALVIDKVANGESTVITGSVAAPSTFTWTLSYTLTNGPVTGAFITDTLPTGLNYVAGSASPAAGFTLSGDGRTLRWDFATLTSSGSVSFQTSVDVATISRSAATVNVATIDSNETSPDTGQDQITVTVSSVLGGNPTPAPGAVPNTAVGLPTTNGVPIVVLALTALLGLGLLARHNVMASRNRR